MILIQVGWSKNLVMERNLIWWGGMEQKCRLGQDSENETTTENCGLSGLIGGVYIYIAPS
jgi:hypothetical protein